MQTTTNIGLKTYEANDPTDWLGDFNYNMNKIDTAVGAQNDQIELIEETAGTAVTTANTASATATEALTTAEGKTSINDNVASATTTYSSNKINSLLSDVNESFPDYGNNTVVATTNTLESGNYLRVDYTATEDCYLCIISDFVPTQAGIQIVNIHTSSGSISFAIQFENHFYIGLTSPIYKVKAGDELTTRIGDLDSSSTSHEIKIYKIPIIN